MPDESYDKIVDVATVLFAHFSKSQSSIDRRTSINIIKHHKIHHRSHYDTFLIFQSFGTYTHGIRSESKIKFLLSTRGSPILPYQTRWLPTPTLSRLDHNSIFGPLNVSITLRSFQRPVTRFRARDDRHALCSPVLTCRPACLCPQPVRLGPWRPTKSHPADLILKQIINSDARHIGWSCGLAAVPHRHGTWLLDRKTLLFVPGSRAEGMAKQSHATALTLRPSAGVDARPRRENLEI